MKAHPIPRGTGATCLCDGSPAQYGVDFGGGKRFEICGACFNAVFGKQPTPALQQLIDRSSTATAREAFKSWMEHLGAVDAARRLGGSLY